MGSPVVSSVPNSQTWLGLLAGRVQQPDLDQHTGLIPVRHA